MKTVLRSLEGYRAPKVDSGGIFAVAEANEKLISYRNRTLSHILFARKAAPIKFPAFEREKEKEA